jgi:hypothetical protein
MILADDFFVFGSLEKQKPSLTEKGRLAPANDVQRRFICTRLSGRNSLGVNMISFKKTEDSVYIHSCQSSIPRHTRINADRPGVNTSD